MALEVQVHRTAERFGPEQRMLHADQLGAFFINRRRVEIIDFNIAIGAHGMRHRARIFGELLRAQKIDRADALYRTRAHVAGKFLVAEDGKPFL